MSAQSKSPKKQAKLVLLPKVEKVYRCTVRLICGPFPLKKGQRKPLRVIDIRGDQTLDDLHEAIFDAFERYDMHLYEFQIGGRAPMDLRAVRYGLPEDNGEDEKDAEAARIEDLHLAIGEIFFYWFDFGDDWMHEIRLDAILTSEGGEHYPRLVKKQGTSPPQYPGIDDEEEEEEEDDDVDVDEDDKEKMFEILDSIIAPENICNPEKVQEAIRSILHISRLTPKHDPERLAKIFITAADFCGKHLNHDYSQVCLNLLIHVDQERDLALDKGTIVDWAAALVHVAGFVNFLDDPANEPFMKLADIARHLGVAKSTMENRSRSIRKVLEIDRLSCAFCTIPVLAHNPQVWFLENEKGFIFDVRQAPREVQEQAFAAGLIPWIPADFPDLHKEPTPSPKRQSNKKSASKKTLKKEPPQDQCSLFDALPNKGKDKT
jgi:hypothetical protein